MALVAWKTDFELGIAPLDDTHKEFIDWLNRLDAASDEEFIAGLPGLIEHTKAHFEMERRWMVGSSFPPIACHKGIHDEIVKIAEFVQGKLSKGDLTLARGFIQELVPWFEDHAGTMDAALAQWIIGTGYQVGPQDETDARDC